MTELPAKIFIPRGAPGLLMYFVWFLFSHGNDEGRNGYRKWYYYRRVPHNYLFTGKLKSKYEDDEDSPEDITLV